MIQDRARLKIPTTMYGNNEPDTAKISRREFLDLGATLSISPFILRLESAIPGPPAPAGTDYAFVVAPSIKACNTDPKLILHSYLCKCQTLFSMAGNTEYVPAIKGRNTLQGFINYLVNEPQVKIPTGNIIVAAHYTEGELSLKLFPLQKEKEANYETVDDSLAVNANSILIPDELFGYNGGTNKIFGLKGCNIGKDLPFLVKLKEAIGGHLNVTAPKHFHGLWETPGLTGILELMAYEFKILSPRALSRADFIMELQNAKYKYYDGPDIPDHLWDGWVPKQDYLWEDATHIITKVKEKYRSGKRSIDWKTGAPLGRFNRLILPTQLEYRVQIEGPIYKDYDNEQSVPSDIKAFVAQEIDSIVKFNIPSNFPYHQRLGCATKQEFLDAHNWVRPPGVIELTEAGKIRLNVYGIRYKYVLRVPIADRLPANAGNLIFNFYPYANSNVAARANQQLTEPLTGSGNNFYARV